MGALPGDHRKAGRRLMKMRQVGTVTYEWEPGAVKNLNLRVRPDGSVHLSSPRRVPAKAADEFVRSRLAWTEAALQRIATRRNAQAAPLANGSTVQYLGNPLTLVVTGVSGKGSGAILGERLYLPVKKPGDLASLEKAYTRWQKEELARIFAQCSQVYYPHFAGRHIQAMPALKIRVMKSRWGSCNRQTNTITLNARLLEKPLAAVEYVILHEYAHFAQGDHSAAFYKVVGQYMPDYAQRRRLLKG